MKRFWCSAALVLFMLIISACRGSDDGPKLTAVVELDISELPHEDVDETTSQLIDIIERRVRDLGGSDFDATVSEPSTISFEFANLDAEPARAAFETGFLDFREPVLNHLREITCQTTDGGQFEVDPQAVTETVSDTGGKVAQCVGTAGKTGTVVWKPTVGTDSQGETQWLTGSYLMPNTTQVLTGPGNCVPACVQLEFTNEGALLFEQITTRLVNYPLGAFVDGQLIWAPQVRTVISNGQTVITGLSQDEANALMVQLNPGPLPVPVKLLSIEES